MCVQYGSDESIGTGVASVRGITGFYLGISMQRHTTLPDRNSFSNIWQPVGAIGGAVILGIVLPMIKGCQERTMLTQEQQPRPGVSLTDDAPEVASTKH